MTDKEAIADEGRSIRWIRTVFAAVTILIVSLGRGYHALSISTLNGIASFFRLNWDETTQLGVWAGGK